jgi:hypothetical protein
MKYDYERIALWSIVAVLVIAVFFQQRRSGFSLQTNADTSSVSLIDLMEYKYIPESKRAMYKSMIESNVATLSSITDASVYKMKLDQIMMTALNMPSAAPPSSSPSQCSNVYIMGGCSAYRTCPDGLNTSMNINGNVYCICSVSSTGERYNMISATSSGGSPKCSNTAAACPQSTITETITGQKMCVTSCPTVMMPGTTCT